MTTINEIDQHIDAVRTEMMLRLRFNPGMSAQQWQAAWDRCPDLRRREGSLFSLRYDATQEIDRQAHQAHLRSERIARNSARKAASRIVAGG